MKHTFSRQLGRADRTADKLKHHGWVEIDLGVPEPIDEYADWEGWFDRICAAVYAVSPWLEQRNIDFRILHGNFFVRKRNATLVRLRWAGQF